MKRLSQDEELRLLYESREKAINDEKTRLEGARQEGREEGREEGIEIGGRNEAIEVARNLFKMGFGVEQVMLATTKLTISEVEAIQREVGTNKAPRD